MSFFELVSPGTTIDFIGKRRLCAGISLALIAASVIAIPVRGIRLGIDFAGGTEILVRFEPGGEPTEGAVREVITTMAGVEAPTVVRFGDVEDREFLIKFAGTINDPALAAVASSGVAEASAEELAAAEAAVEQEEAAPAESAIEDEGLAEAAIEELAAAPDAAATAEILDAVAEDADAIAADETGVRDRVDQIEAALAGAIGPLTIERVDFVGPRVGAELRDDGLLSLFWASLCILIYVAVRFSSRFAPGAIIAVLHDLIITAGIFIMLGLDFDLRILAAMLAILGYSLNDTIIIYDRIRENMQLRTKVDLPEVLNQSVNQTLSRTVLTSGTTLVALGSLFALGGEMIQPFAFAMLIGVVVGTYSSIYIAAPTLLLLEQRRGAGA